MKGIKTVQGDIIESFVMGKTGRADECEDVIVIGEHFYAVIDGVTSKFPVTYEGKSAGRYCAEILPDAIAALDKDADAVSAFKSLDSAIGKAYGDREITQESKMQAILLYTITVSAEQ